MIERPEYIDIHSHVQFPIFDEERIEIINRSLAEKIWTIQVGTALETSTKAVSLARSYENGVFAAVGLHPVHTSPSRHDEQELSNDLNEKEYTFSENQYESLTKDSKTVAIGECGLDYFRTTELDAKERQVKAFEKQIEFSLLHNLPLMIHCRNAYKEVLDILKSYKNKNILLRGDIHFFAGSWEEARQFFDLEFTLSFTGVITFARTYDESIQNAPLSMIMSETDCPYVAPIPYRGKRNEPFYIKEIVKKIAEIRGQEHELVKEALVQNAFRFFSF